MRWIRNWILPVITCGIVLAGIFLPPQLSGLRDRQWMGRVQAETLATDYDLHIQTLTLEERIGLVSLWLEDSESIVVAEQAIQTSAQNDLEPLVRRELQYLVDAGVLSAESVLNDLSAREGQKIYLQAERVRAGFIQVEIYSESEKKYLSMVLDEESGHALVLNLVDTGVVQNSGTPLELGKAFLKGIDIAYDQIAMSEKEALFFQMESESQYYVFLWENELYIKPLGNWGIQTEMWTDVGTHTDSYFDTKIYDSDGILIQKRGETDGK